MIRVTVEAIDGRTGMVENIGVAEIYRQSSEVDAQIFDVTLSHFRDPKKIWESGRVEGYNGKGRGTWDMLYYVLKNIVGYRQDET